jgi:hypothetical protein
MCPLLQTKPANATRPSHPKEKAKMSDDFVEEGRRVREALIAQFGGIDGYVKHLQAQDRAEAARLKSARRKRPAKATRKSAKHR